MNTWTTSVRRMVNVARAIDTAIWVDVAEVEAVLSQPTRLRMKSGTEYRTDRPAKEVLDLLFPKEEGVF